jgi:hypothetical protein
VQFAAVFGEPTNVILPESVIETFRDNVENYQSPDSDWAMLNFTLYYNQPIEVDARVFGSQFRTQTRRFVPRIPDDSNFRTIFIFTLAGVILVIIRSSHIPPAPPSFKKCVLDLHDKKKISKKPLKLIRNFHNRLAFELRMLPCPYIDLLSPTSDLHSWSDGTQNHTEIAINKKCLKNPMYTIHAIAKETWKVCHLAFEELSEAEELSLNSYISSIMLRAENIIESPKSALLTPSQS